MTTAILKILLERKKILAISYPLSLQIMRLSFFWITFYYSDTTSTFQNSNNECITVRTFMRNLTSWNSYMQNIHAEFNQLYLTVSKFSSIGLYFGAICLQESWQASDADLSLLQLPGNKIIHQGSKCTKHGRLLIFLSEIRLSYCATKQIFWKFFLSM